MVTITLTDFQAHESTAITVVKNFACIVGPTNAGKSSIVRATRWLLYDSLRGQRFIRAGQSSASVKLKFTDVEIERSKGKTGNRYRLDATWFDTIGVGTPPEVVKALKIPLMQIDKDTSTELNVSMQLHPQFLVLDTDSLKAKFLNALTGGHILDAAVRETNRRIRELESESARTKADLEATSTELKKYDGLERREVELLALDTHLVRMEILMERSLKLSEIRSKLTSIRSTKAKVQKQLDLIPNGDYSKVVAKVSNLESLLEAAERIRRIRATRIDVEHRKINCVNQLNELKAKFLNLPHLSCENCGQSISTELKHEHLKEIGV